MKIRYFFLIILLSAAIQQVSAQDTLRVMQYNLMFYGLYTDFCTAENNNADAKDEYLRTITGYYQPDIFVVNELGRGAHNLTRLRDNVFNVNGNDHFEYATYTNTGNGWFANGLFYDSRKFGLYEEAIVNTYIRDINLYTLYYKSDDLAHTQDTVFLTLVLAHLKAGNSTSDQQDRLTMVRNVMNYLGDNNYTGNVMFLGDFNMKSSYEQAYQLLLYHPNEDIRFYDPIGVEGVWGNNRDMAPYHTQSPRTGSHPCFVTGGLDDRYDIILASEEVMKGHGGLQYVQDSYLVPGQDGNRYNQSLIDPPNFSAPEEIIYAMYNMSDHLPVMLELQTVDFITASIRDENIFSISVANPVKDNLIIHLENTHDALLQVDLFRVDGLWIDDYAVDGMHSPLLINVDSLPPGVYLLRFLFASSYMLTKKIIKL